MANRSKPELVLKKHLKHESENGKDIFIMTEMTQDVEREPSASITHSRSRDRSEAGSEKDLIFQRN